MHFSSAKSCLLHYGKIKEITRGRISADNHAFLAERLGHGDTIAGYESVVSTKPTGQTVHSNKNAPVSTEKTIADIGTARYDERETEAYYFFDGRKVGVSLRECCANCRASFSYHVCDNPTFRTLDIPTPTPVYFGARTKPFKKGW
mgnify:CR=1 FL=1